MPYILKRVKNGYYVVNAITGKKYSNKPLTLAMAKRQLTALHIVTHE
jgi:hypothetical protein